MSKRVILNEQEWEKKYNCSHKTICARLRKYHVPLKSSEYYRGNKSVNWKGYGELSSLYWWHVKEKAQKRNLEFNLNIEDAWHLFLEQDRKCVLTGIPLKINNRYAIKDHNNIASIDRIDSSKGYTIDNIQWVHKYINVMKWQLSQQEFIDMCNKVTEHNK